MALDGSCPERRGEVVCWLACGRTADRGRGALGHRPSVGATCIWCWSRWASGAGVACAATTGGLMSETRRAVGGGCAPSAAAWNPGGELLATWVAPSQPAVASKATGAM